MPALITVSSSRLVVFFFFFFFFFGVSRFQGDGTAAALHPVPAASIAGWPFHSFQISSMPKTPASPLWLAPPR
jgi:hypothetical protein